ncbi:hypothetical protein T10_5550 [Trichinella papuae]|uniref:Uncharacterized protein n=1 Tax=Trichinella papuae TaxID=268474 RepID=A0A0V1MD46_9BILA|nr:hypothetical protein T10_5550 [Trichinella papuae]
MSSVLANKNDSKKKIMERKTSQSEYTSSRNMQPFKFFKFSSYVFFIIYKILKLFCFRLF